MVHVTYIVYWKNMKQRPEVSCGYNLAWHAMLPHSQPFARIHSNFTDSTKEALDGLAPKYVKGRRITDDASTVFSDTSHETISLEDNEES